MAYLNNDPTLQNIKDAIEDLSSIIAEEFSTTTNYSTGDYVIYNENLYQFTTTHIGEWDLSHVNLRTISNHLESLKEMAYIDDAPSDDNNYVRRNKSWRSYSGEGDGYMGAAYDTGEQGIIFEASPNALGTLAFENDASSDNKAYARQNKSWVELGTLATKDKASLTSDVTGVLPANNGGTGENTLNDSANALINALSLGSSTLKANDYIITQYVDGGTTVTTYHRRPASVCRVGGLTTPRKLKVALNSTTDITFDGTADRTNIPVSGTLPVANGGTSATTAADARTNLGVYSTSDIDTKLNAKSDGKKTFTSFSAIPADFCGICHVAYTGIDNDAPLTTSFPWWWTVIQLDGSSSTRMTQIATSVFRNREYLWIRQKHDSSWFGWYIINQEDSGWYSLTNDNVFTNAPINYRKIGKILYISASSVRLKTASSAAAIDLGTLPVGYRVSATTTVPAGTVSKGWGAAYIRSDGLIQFYKPTGATQWETSDNINFMGAFIAA